MSTTSPGFLRRLFLRPALWVAMLPGTTLTIFDYGCLGYQHVLHGWVCDLAFFKNNKPVVGLAFFYLDALLYAALQALDAKKSWNTTHRITWILEIALLVIGEYIVFFTVLCIGFFTMSDSL